MYWVNSDGFCSNTKDIWSLFGVLLYFIRIVQLFYLLEVNACNPSYSDFNLNCYFLTTKKNFLILWEVGKINNGRKTK